MWDLGAVMWIIIDCFTSQVAFITIISSSEEVDFGDNNNNNLDCTRTDLDIHENMATLVKNVHVTNCTGREA